MTIQKARARRERAMERERSAAPIAREPAPFVGVCSANDRPAWLAARRATIGASEVAAVLGVEHAYGSAISVWAEKTGRVERDPETPEWMFWGNELEPSILTGYAKRTGRRCVPFGVLLRSTRFPWLSATPDGLVSESATLRDYSELCRAIDALRMSPSDETAAGMVWDAIRSRVWWPIQLKNLGYQGAQHWEHGVPLYYRVQCAQEAIVMGAPMCTGAALISGQRLAWEDVPVDTSITSTLERQIVNVSRTFYERHIVADVEPRADASEHARRTLIALYPTAKLGTTLALGADLMQTAARLDQAKADAAALKKQITGLENAIRQAIGQNETAVFADGTGYTLRQHLRNGKPVRTLRRVKGSGEEGDD